MCISVEITFFPKIWVYWSDSLTVVLSWIPQGILKSHSVVNEEASQWVGSYLDDNSVKL